LKQGRSFIIHAKLHFLWVADHRVTGGLVVDHCIVSCCRFTSRRASVSPPPTALRLRPPRLCISDRGGSALSTAAPPPVIESEEASFFFHDSYLRLNQKKKILKYNIIVVYCNFYEFNLYALILHCQPMTTMYSATSPHFTLFFSNDLEDWWFLIG
jgi:hypothetical protein